jgi:hypothetical protein
MWRAEHLTFDLGIARNDSPEEQWRLRLCYISVSDNECRSAIDKMTRVSSAISSFGISWDLDEWQLEWWLKGRLIPRSISHGWNHGTAWRTGGVFHQTGD